jgi:hypothetical protein
MPPAKEPSRSQGDLFPGQSQNAQQPLYQKPFSYKHRPCHLGRLFEIVSPIALRPQLNEAPLNELHQRTRRKSLKFHDSPNLATFAP